MAEQKYEEDADPAEDIAQSGVHFVSIEPDPIEYFCERLYPTVQHFCPDKQLCDALPADAPEDADELDPLFDAEDFPQPFINMVLDNATDIFKAGNESQANVIEFTFNLVFSLLFENTNTLHSNIERLSNILSSQSDAFSRVNIKLLCLLFNTVPAQNRLRPVVMQRLLDVGKKMKSMETQELFGGRLNGLEEWIEDDWSKYLSIADQKRLYQSASAVAAKCAEKEIYLKYLIKYLRLFDSDRAQKGNDNVVDEAAQAVIAAISSEEFNTRYVMELISSQIVCKVMASTPKYVELFKLLDIVYQGNVADFDAFYKRNTRLFVSDSGNDEGNAECLGLLYSTLQRKMRLLTLCSLGNVTQTKEPSYGFTELMEKLSLSSQSELEELIIDAITKKLLYAKIDYESQQVDITRAKQRTFNKNSWQDLSNRLKLWRQNTNTVLQIIHNAGLNRWRQQYMQQMQRNAVGQ